MDFPVFRGQMSVAFYPHPCRCDTGFAHWRAMWKNESKVLSDSDSELQVIDSDGFRPNVGIILCNERQSVFWCKRLGQNAWQFPQGGIRSDETPREAMFRELREETGLLSEHVEVIGATRGWLRYRLPRRMIRHHVQPCCVGQKQVWFMLRMVGSESDVNLASSHRPEFDGWRWVDYWQPARDVVFFKRHVYERALRELAPLVFPNGGPPMCSIEN